MYDLFVNLNRQEYQEKLDKAQQKRAWRNPKRDNKSGKDIRAILTAIINLLTHANTSHT